MIEISGSTGLICLLGHPVAHSVSPKMHNTAFDALGLDFAYLAFDVTEEKAADAITSLRLFGARGANLTMPLKQCVLAHLDRLAPAAELSGSVNTIVNDNGVLTGHTTDGIGYLDALRYEADFEIAGKKMIILGAGGAAESIITQAALDGAKRIFIMRRQNEKYAHTVSFAKKIAERTGCGIVVSPIEDTAALRENIRSSDLLCHATNVGMGDDSRSLVPKELLRNDLFVSDIIYHPAETTLLRDAKEAGCRCMNGAFMLLYQGAAAFRLWTGKDMPVDLIKRTCFL